LEAILMSRCSRGLAVALLSSVAVLSACGHTATVAAPSETPVQLTAVAGSDLKSVTLSEQSEARLAISITQVAAAEGAPAGQLQVPYSAIVYDESGGTWVFTPTAPRTYLRQPVTVDHIAGSVAVLSAGPAVGTPVVAVGSQELLGAEYDISGEG
jgi:hypothetical protein